MNSVVAIRAFVEAEVPFAFAPCARPEQKFIPTGIEQIDALTRGIPIGGLTELCGSDLPGGPPFREAKGGGLTMFSLPTAVSALVLEASL